MGQPTNRTASTRRHPHGDKIGALGCRGSRRQQSFLHQLRLTGVQVFDIEVVGRSVLGQRRVEILRLLEVIQDLKLPRRQFLSFDRNLCSHACPPLVWERAG
jgi:hypothetical protein